MAVGPPALWGPCHGRSHQKPPSLAGSQFCSAGTGGLSHECFHFPSSPFQLEFQGQNLPFTWQRGLLPALARLVSPRPPLPGPALRVASGSNPDRGGGGGRETKPGSGRNSFQGAEGGVRLEAEHPRWAGRCCSVLRPPGQGDFSDAGAFPRSLGSGRSPPHLSLFPFTVLHLTAGRGQQCPAGVPPEKVE